MNKVLANIGISLYNHKMSLKFLPALATSLLPDPFYQAITAGTLDSAQRLDTLKRYFEYAFREAERTGRVVVSADPEDGASIWLLPRSEEIYTRESVDKTAVMTQLLSPHGGDNYRRILEFMTPLASKHIPATAWYLSILGINPSKQGNGLGALLLQPTLSEADQAKAPTYLETFSARSLRFYERLGFRCVAQYVEPVTNAPYFIMLRDARK